MRIVRCRTSLSDEAWGVLRGDRITRLKRSPFAGEFRESDASLANDGVLLLAPATPTKIVCVGRNYRAHVDEMGWAAQLDPVLFLKPPPAVIGTGADIQLPATRRQVEPEPELAVVIGKRARSVARDDALAHVFGYVLANDVSARDLMSSDGQWTRAKGYDTFCPVGPWVETELSLVGTRIRMTVDGVEVTNEGVDAMRMGVSELIELASAVFTLEPGDIILTGSPAGRTPLAPGSDIRIFMEGLGVLQNPVVAAPAPSLI